MFPSVLHLQSCLCGNEHADATRSSNSSPRRSPHPTCARTLQTPLHERIVRALSAAWEHAQGTESDRCVVLCCNDACVRALTANNLSYISITIHMSMQLSYKKGYLERIWPQQSEKKEQRGALPAPDLVDRHYRTRTQRSTVSAIVCACGDSHASFCASNHHMKSIGDTRAQ